MAKSALDVVAGYATDTGAFRVTNQGATELAAACAALIELVDVANRAAIAASRGEGGRPGTIRNKDLDELRAALAKAIGEQE